MSKMKQCRADVYQAIDEMDRDGITVEEIVEFVRWDASRETAYHYVRDSLRDFSMIGIVTVEKDGPAIRVSRTAQFSKKMISNPWVA